MSKGTYRPEIRFVGGGGADDATWNRADAIIARLGNRVTKINGSSWRWQDGISAFGPEQAVVTVEEALGVAADDGWEDVLQVVSEPSAR
jgi:hypothetical protein